MPPNNYSLREMVKAMQDPGAGVKLVEFGPKRGRAATKYFTGAYIILYV